jgi:uncharacterized membrane-anchored protein
MRKTILATSVAALLLSANLCAQDSPPPPPGAAADDGNAQAREAQQLVASMQNEASTQADAASAQASGSQQPDLSDPRVKQAQQLVASLNFQSGEIAIPEAKAHLHLGEGFRFLPKSDARKVLEQLWGNPPDDKIIGLIVPTDPSLLSDKSWATLVTYVDDGHVSDEDAAKTDYDKLLKDMKEGTQAENEERKKAGYDAIELVGWAAPPRYDAQGKKLYWARELAIANNSGHTLNYDIRVLGRTGYLSLNAIARMQDLPDVQGGMQRILPMVDFDAGQRYADFNPSTDKLAAYGIAALVAGGIAAKAGLFAKIGVILLAAKKLVIVIIAAIGAGIKKLFGGKDKNKPGPTVQ